MKLTTEQRIEHIIKKYGYCIVIPIDADEDENYIEGMAEKCKSIDEVKDIEMYHFDIRFVL